MRKFEKISFKQFTKDFANYQHHERLYEELIVPKRNTKLSAGYDFSSPIEFILEPNKSIKVPTGIKVRMNEGECLAIIVRSSLGFKYNIRLCNQVGIIDTDYYNNIENEGHIWLALHNHGDHDLIVKRGDRLAQGIFLKFLTVDDEDKITHERVSGLGSTGKGRDEYE